MAVELTFSNLIEYTEWERAKWHDWFLEHGDLSLKVSTGPHSDGRMQTIGELVRHIFSAEMRYIDRLSGRAITETASIPTDEVEALFQFARLSRKHLTEFIEQLPPAEWDQIREFPLMNSTLRATHKKVVAHILMHEIRHWAQIATLLRMSGLPLGEFHDFLFSPVFGGEFEKVREQATKA